MARDRVVAKQRVFRVRRRLRIVASGNAIDIGTRPAARGALREDLAFEAGSDYRASVAEMEDAGRGGGILGDPHRDRHERRGKIGR